MAWTVKFHEHADDQFQRLDKAVQRRIIKFIEKRLVVSENPRRIGEPLTGPLKTFWKYRVGDYRLVCDVQDGAITILVVKVGHRSSVYRE